MKQSISIITLILLLGITTSRAQHGTHTNGIEPYYHPKDLSNYLESIDPVYLPYMFASDEDMRWWKEAKFGIFVHWAPSVVTEAPLSWGRKGPRPHHSSDGTVKKGVPQQEYNDTYKTFNPVNFDAEEWVKTWKKAGARYFVFTAKHHYGFCMWDTKTTDFNIMNTPYGKDVMKDIADACEKHDMRLMWYYSQPDWTHPYYAENVPHQRYNDEILFPQLEELMSYKGIDGIWFDGLGLHPDRWNSPKMLKMIRDVNPNAIVNHRHGPPQWHMGDFDGPERGVGRFQVNRPWETCDVIAGAWAYNGESDPAPIGEVIKALTKVAVNGGNLLLGTGPRPDGSNVDNHVARLTEMGDYLAKYGESIYATQGGPYISGPWGGATYKGNKVYLHLMGNKEGKALILPQLPANVKAFKALTNNTGIEVSNTKKGLVVKYDARQDDELFPVIELTINKDAASITPIATSGHLLLQSVKLQASSDKAESFASKNLLPGAGEDFSEGIRIKKSWRPSDQDEEPSLEYSWEQPQKIKQISIKEGRRLDKSKVKAFQIQSWNKGQWETIHKGSNIGRFYGVNFTTPVNTSKLRITFENAKGLEINKVLIYNIL
ncbi:alpha-L-fucosidase [Carboxylicivirga sp. M1479]|uniref:alpha-L-fucosidase n=1 Tax=Carboxylicivirga sp. M1479 TaxID=2594476 RepID=UPI0011774F21|nr:alpha-L-fucosidase [Carboxylicivirga sp. M1479]TRX66087.1 hypothetical protein FNN09_15445 [Carboxylicivirga sp. M1479]